MSEDKKPTEAESAAPEGTSRRKFLKGGLVQSHVAKEHPKLCAHIGEIAPELERHLILLEGVFVEPHAVVDIAYLGVDVCHSPLDEGI